jgi:outer membrane biosynthesis protein TonB
VPVVGPRFLIEAGFIIAVAVIAGILRLGTAWIVAVMAAAWLIVAAVEITISRRRARAEAKPVPRRPPARPPARPTAQPPPPQPAPPPPRPPEPEPELEPEPERPGIVAVPPLPPPLEPEPEPEPEPEKVVALPVAAASPREWNLWELDRVAREHTSGDVARDEERAYLLMYLREFAGPDGVLPSDFDGLVRDAFGDVLHTVG